MLLDAVGLSTAEYQAALAYGQEKSLSLLHALEILYPGKEEAILAVFSAFYEIPSVNLSEKEIPLEILALLPKTTACKLRVLPISQSGTSLLVAMGDPRNVEALDTIGFKAGLFARPVLASEMQLTRALEKYYGTLDVTRLHAAAEPQIQSHTALTQARKTIGTGIGEK